MKQLKMMRFDEPVVDRALPEGYTFEFYNGTDEQIRDWLDICSNGLISGGTAESFHAWITNWTDCDVWKDLFFVVDPNGRRVATSTSIKCQNGDGYVHMVANVPECRGLGIGHAMLAFGVKILLDRGCKRITLTTDDNRLAAIKTYLDGGFHPVMWHDDDSDMDARWDAVLKELNYQREVTRVPEE